MSSLTDLPELVGFFSYSREDDEGSHGALSALRERIQHELRAQLGRSFKSFRLWQDKEAIPSGSMWESEIKNAVGQAVFFIPIITPTVIASPFCKFELDAFLAREAELARDDLVFPILYIDVPGLEDSGRQNDAVLSLIGKRQYFDWREYRYLDVNSTEVRRAVGRFCVDIRDALRKPWMSPEERKAQAQAEARRLAEENERQASEERQRQVTAEAERKRAEQDAAAKRESEESARQAAAAEAERQRQEREAAAAHAAEEERNRRERAARERAEAHKVAMTSDDPAILRAFLQNHPSGPAADEARQRLRILKPQAGWRGSQRPLAVAATLAVVLVGAVIVWLQSGAPTSVPEPSPAFGPPVALLSPEQERTLKPKDTFTECSSCPQMVVVPAGSFNMGSPAVPGTPSDEAPRHNVKFAVQFAVGQFELTFDQWDACAVGGGCNGYKPRDNGWGRGRRPVIYVSWDDARAYVAWLRTRTDKEYRLLTEAEYEYAARAGSETMYPWGDDLGRNNTNCDTCGSRWDKQTAPVGSFAANGFGLYDLIGNVREWTDDCYHYGYFGAPTNGAAWVTGGECTRRQVRGGSWDYRYKLQSAARDVLYTNSRSYDLGFRVARTLMTP
jgi:formylglycine-generating enzyme required for sulfatase activity